MFQEAIASIIDIEAIEPPNPEPPDLSDPEPIVHTINYSTTYHLFDPDPDPDPDQPNQYKQYQPYLSMNQTEQQQRLEGSAALQSTLQRNRQVVEQVVRQVVEQVVGQVGDQVAEQVVEQVAEQVVEQVAEQVVGNTIALIASTVYRGSVSSNDDSRT